MPGVLLAAALLALPLVVLMADSRTDSTPAVAVVGASIFATALVAPTLYCLQKVAGQVKLSQIVYVAAAFGVAISALAFGEAISLRLVIAAALIVAGARFVNAQRGRSEPMPCERDEQRS